MELLSHYLTKHFNFTQEEIEHLTSYFSKKEFKKEEHFLQEGQHCKQIGFVEKGALVYLHNLNGEEKVCDFAFEDSWVTQIKSLMQGLPSELSIKTLEDTVLWIISADKMMQLFSEMPKFLEVRMKLADHHFIEASERSNDLANLSGEERYQKLLLKHPQIAQRVPQYYIAAFLGITQRHLSRIRAQH